MIGPLDALRALDAFRALGALDLLVPLGTLRPLLPFRTLELRLALRAIAAVGSFHAVLAPVLAAVGASIFLPGMVGAIFPPIGAAIFLPVRATVFLAVRAAVLLSVGLAIRLPVSAAIFLANVGLRDRGGSASQSQGGDGDCNDSFLPHERFLSEMCNGRSA